MFPPAARLLSGPVTAKLYLKEREDSPGLSAPRHQNTRRPCAGSHSPAAAHGSPATLVPGCRVGGGQPGWLGDGPSSREDRRAVQSKPGSPSPYPATAVPGDELAGIRCGIAPARQPDRVVQRDGDRGLARRAAQHTRRPAALLCSGNCNGTDPARRVRPCLRQTEGLIGSIVRLLGLDLAVPDHSTLSRRAETLKLVRPVPSTEPVHLLVDSTGLRLCGPSGWLIEKHGARTRRSWKKPHFGVDANTGEIIATTLTSHDVDDGSQVGPLLD